MAYDEKYYKNKKLELTKKTQRNVQRLIQFVFDFVMDQSDLNKRLKELEDKEIESKKKTGVKEKK